MLSFPRDRKVFIITGVTDLRKAFTGLRALVGTKLGRDPGSGLFVFANRARKYVKILYDDDDGAWLAARKVRRGRFAWPESEESVVEVGHGELERLLERKAVASR